jgi:hypothetical protein
MKHARARRMQSVSCAAGNRLAPRRHQMLEVTIELKSRQRAQVLVGNQRFEHDLAQVIGDTAQA